MSTGRIALIAAGLLVAVGALFLVVRGFRGAAPAPAATGAPAAAGTSGAPPAKGEQKPPPRWQSFLRPGEREIPPRPLVHFAQGLKSPFERPAAAAVAVKVENPGLRLEGISQAGKPVALVSGHALRVGDTVSGFRVARIGRSSVILAGPEGERLDLALGEPAPAPPATGREVRPAVPARNPAFQKAPPPTPYAGTTPPADRHHPPTGTPGGGGR